MLEDLFKVVKARFNDETAGKSEDSGENVSIPKDLLFKCPRCGTVAYMEDFEKNRRVCAACNYHARLKWQDRLNMTADADSFTEFDAGMIGKNPINFPDYEKNAAKVRNQRGRRYRRMSYTRLPLLYRDNGQQLYDGQHGQRGWGKNLPPFRIRHGE